MKFIDGIKKILRSIYAPVFWTVATLVLLALPGSLLPSEAGFSIPQADKIVHICLFGGFVFLWCFYVNGTVRPKKWPPLFFLIYVSGNAIGIGMEFVQRCCIPNRDYSLGDMIADMIGAGIAYGICNIWLVVENNAQ